MTANDEAAIAYFKTMKSEVPWSFVAIKYLPTSNISKFCTRTIKIPTFLIIGNKYETQNYNNNLIYK